jgi:hypothetical protein
MPSLSQRRMILEHLIDRGSITSWEAIQEYGITRLACYINMLKRENKIITDKWEENNGKRFKVYSLTT